MARRRGDPGTPRVSLLGAEFTALAAIGTERLAWPTSRVAGPLAKDLRRETGAKAVSVDALLDKPNAEIVVVGTPQSDRIDHAAQLLASGVHVVMAPCHVTDDDAGRLRNAAESGGARFTLADPFPTSPAVQRWFAQISDIGEIEHMSGTVTVAAATEVDVDPLLWSMLDVVRFSAVQAGWGILANHRRTDVSETRSQDSWTAPSGNSVRIDVLTGNEAAPPRWELQAASSTDAIRVSMLPTPEVERSGSPLPLVQPHPSVALGIGPLLRSFWNQVLSGEPVSLHATFAAGTSAMLAESAQPNR